MNLPGREGAAGEHRVYIWRVPEVNPRLIAAIQMDEGEFDADALAAFLDRFITEMREPGAGAAEARVPGIIEFHEDGSQGVLTAPDRAEAGQNFQVTVTTFGGGCERAGEMDVLMTGDGATLLVYDLTTATGPAAICPAILKRLEHTVTLSFAQPGEYTIQVWGRRVAADTPAAGVPAVLEHTVVVE
jgi:hypothetical protein